MKSRRRLIPLVCTMLAVTFLQSCSLRDQLLFSFAFYIQERWKWGVDTLVHGAYLPGHVGLGCGVITINGALPNDLKYRPDWLMWTLKIWHDSSYTRKRILVPVNDDGTFSRSIDTPGSNFTNGGTSCPNWEFNANTQLDFYVRPIGGFVPIHALVLAFLAVRPIVELKKCHPTVIPTEKVPSRAAWWKQSRPGKSTLQLNTTGTIGVKVHCAGTSDGDQGTFRVVYTDRTTELISITCKD